jgi:hypothetical protein
MRGSVFVVLLIACLVSANLEFADRWNVYRVKCKLAFVSPSQEAHFYSTYVANLLEFERRNHVVPEPTHKLGETCFTHMTSQEFADYNHFVENARSFREFKRLHSIVPPHSIMTDTPPFHSIEPEASFDWRTKPNNVVSPIQNQGRCGSCYSFSATGAVYGCKRIKGASTPVLSSEQIVDCSSPEGNHGCTGGWSIYGFQYIMGHGGINSETGYPYTLGNSTVANNCSATGAATSVATITGIAGLPYNDQSGMVTYLSTNPLSVSFQGSSYDFQHYVSGIITTSACWTGSIDHAALVVAYGNGYWVVKNQWGTSWGELGYVRIKRDTSSPGTCGIASYTVWPTCTLA